MRAGFHGDFFLVIHPAHSALFNNGGAGSLFWLPDHKHCFFDANGPNGPGSLGTFLRIWNEHQAGCDRPGMATWRKKLFLAISRNAANPVEVFHLPEDRTIVMVTSSSEASHPEVLRDRAHRRHLGRGPHLEHVA